MPRPRIHPEGICVPLSLSVPKPIVDLLTTKADELKITRNALIIKLIKEQLRHVA
jgi:hypothetical protein